MADDDLLVTISGPALSLLLYENRRIHDQIGFLLGEMVKYVSRKITDSDRDVECTKYHINIKYVHPYPIGKPFFDTGGRIHKDILENFLKDNIKKVVGWFHYRKGDKVNTTFRDRNLHSELSTFFSNVNKHFQTEENFIFCLLSSSKSEIGGTHKFKHLVLRCKEIQSNNYIPVPLRINNLGADVTRPDGSDYKPTPMDSSCESDAFDSIYESVRDDLYQKSGLESVILIQKAAEHHLEELILQVSKHDEKISELEIELNQLRQKYYREQFERSIGDVHEMLLKTKSCNISELKSSNTSELFCLTKSYAASISSTKPDSKLSIPSDEIQGASGKHENFKEKFSTAFEPAKRSKILQEEEEEEEEEQEEQEESEQVTSSPMIKSKSSKNVKFLEKSPDREGIDP